MDKKINVISNGEHELEVKLTYEEIKTDLEKLYKEESKNIQVDGFRKGKVPVHIIKKMFGDAIEYKASEKIANSKFWDIVEADELKPISTPSLQDLNFSKEEGISFKVRYEVKPKLELKDYKGLEIEKITYDVKEEEIENEVNHIIKSQAKYEETEVVESNQFRITVDLQRLDENRNPIEGSVSKNMVIDLSDSKVNPQIVDNTQNKKTGETFSFVFTDDRNTDEESKIEEYNYEGTINKIEKIILPEITEDFIKNVSRDKATTIEEYKNQIRENITNYYNMQSENMYTNNLLAKIVENNEFEAPQGYINFLLGRFIETEKENAKKQGQKQVDDNYLRQSLYPKAVWNAKWQIILENIVEAENIKVEDSDIEKLVQEEAAKFNLPVEKLMKYYQDSNRKEGLLEDKVITLLKENNKAVEVNADEKVEKKDKPAKKAKKAENANDENTTEAEAKPKRTRTKKSE